jgi:hypothetical protein
LTRLVVRGIAPDEWQAFREIRLAALADAPYAYLTTLAEAQARPAPWAGDQGDAQLRLWVVESNERAERAYARYGFTRTGRTQPVPGRPDQIEVEMTYALTRAAMIMKDRRD